jgi:hypothetical protein
MPKWHSEPLAEASNSVEDAKVRSQLLTHFLNVRVVNLLLFFVRP